MARQDRDRAIDLFEQHDAHELVGHVAAPKASLKLAFGASRRPFRHGRDDEYDAAVFDAPARKCPQKPCL